MTVSSTSDGLNQTFSAFPSQTAGVPMSARESGGFNSPAWTSAQDIENMPPLDQLLQADWFHQNLSQMLNISMDNLTSLLMNVQHTPPHHKTQQPLLSALTIIYVLIFVAGLFGNLVTCIVISRNKFMHTATNFYLFNLAVSDLILLLSGMPQDLYNLWFPDSYPFTDILCILESVLSETAANATVLTITAFTVERYIAICHPFRQHTMSKLSRAIKFIFAIWVMAFLLALPQAMQFSVVSQDNNIACTMTNNFFAHVFAVSGFIFFGGPMTAICVLYVLIGVKLKRSRLLQAVPRRCYDVNRGISAQSRVIRMLVAVAVAFFLCWAPFHAQRLMAAYGSTSGIQSKLFSDIFDILDYASGVLYFLSTCINPLLYNIMSHKFREAFKVTLARQFGLAGRYQSQHHNYSALLRQNGSMRLHTTDSIRTTTTTTTINSASGSGGYGGGGGGASSRRSSANRNRCVSLGSQSTLLAAIAKNGAADGGAAMQQRMLQHQISQLSSVGDANSLIDPDYHPGTSYRLKELRRSMALANNGTMPPEDCNSSHSQEWDDNNLDTSKHCSDNETELYTKPVAPPIAMPAVQPMNSIAELPLVQPSRSRLKLSRIISRRDQDAYIAQTSPRVELMRSPSKEREAGLKTKIKSGKPLDSLTERFRWRGRKKAQKKGMGGSKRMRQESSSSASSAGTATPTGALTNRTYPVKSVLKANAAREAELGLQNGTPEAL